MAMIDERTSRLVICWIIDATQECAWLYVGLSVVISKQEGVVTFMLGGLQQNRVFVGISSIMLAQEREGRQPLLDLLMEMESSLT